MKKVLLLVAVLSITSFSMELRKAKVVVDGSVYKNGQWVEKN